MIFFVKKHTATAGSESYKRRWNSLHDTVYPSLNFIETFVKKKNEQRRHTSTETGCSLFYLSDNFLLFLTSGLPYLSELAIDRHIDKQSAISFASSLWTCGEFFLFWKATRVLVVGTK